MTNGEGRPARAVILFLAANPASTPRLDLDKEANAVLATLRASKYPNSLTLETRWAVTSDDVLQALNELQPVVVHFSGHGDAEGIALSGSDDAPHYVSAAALRQLFAALDDDIRVVVLNACYSDAQATAIAEVIDCVIGMTDEIEDAAARAFAASFYRALGFGRSVKNAFDQGIAAVGMTGSDDGKVPRLQARAGVDPDQVFLVVEPTPVPASPPRSIVTPSPEPRPPDVPPQGVLAWAIKEVPATKYALGIAGIASAASIILSFFRGDATTAFVATLLALGGALLSLLLANAARQRASEFLWLVRMVMWIVTLLFAGALFLLFTSFFFGKPLDLRPDGNRDDPTGAEDGGDTKAGDGTEPDGDSKPVGEEALGDGTKAAGETKDGGDTKGDRDTKDGGDTKAAGETKDGGDTKGDRDTKDGGDTKGDRETKDGGDTKGDRETKAVVITPPPEVSCDEVCAKNQAKLESSLENRAGLPDESVRGTFNLPTKAFTGDPSSAVRARITGVRFQDLPEGCECTLQYAL